MVRQFGRPEYWRRDVNEAFRFVRESKTARFKGGDDGGAGARGNEDVVGEVGCDEED